MKADFQKGGCWPTPEQEMLLRATLLTGKDAIASWAAWRTHTDFERLDAGSTRLLPLLYTNLRRLKVETELLPRLKGLYRRAWYENQLLFGNTAHVLRALSDAGIETIILKGAPLVLLYYKDYGARPMLDMDILVRPAKAMKAVSVLSGLGLHPNGSYSIKTLMDGYLFVRHATEFRSDKRFNLDLHHHALGRGRTPDDIDDDFWHAAVSVRLGGVVTSALSPTDQLLQVCAHGAHWNAIPPIRWIVDSMTILSSSSIDWERLVEQTAKRSISLPLRDTLAYLRRAFDAPIPDTALAALNRLPTTGAERLEYRLMLKDPDSCGPLATGWLCYRTYSRWAHGAGRRMGLARFLRYLQYTWQLDNLGQVLPSAFDKARSQIVKVRSWQRGRSSDTSSAKLPGAT